MASFYGQRAKVVVKRKRKVAAMPADRFKLVMSYQIPQLRVKDFVEFHDGDLISFIRYMPRISCYDKWMLMALVEVELRQAMDVRLKRTTQLTEFVCPLKG